MPFTTVAAVVQAEARYAALPADEAQVADKDEQATKFNTVLNADESTTPRESDDAEDNEAPNARCLQPGIELARLGLRSTSLKDVSGGMQYRGNASSIEDEQSNAATSRYTAVPAEDGELLNGTAQQKGPATSIEECPPIPVTDQWVPTCLTRPFVFCLMVFNVTIFAAILFLQTQSHLHSGIGTDDDSAAVYFGWRFAPTLVAVVYTFCLMMVLEDVKRTECFARLSHPDGASATNTLFLRSGPWWTTFAHSFPCKQNDYRCRWTSMFSVVAYIMGILVISPLSSTLLEPRETLIKVKGDFQRLVLDTSHPLQLDLDALSFFNTIGNALQNVSTSAWVKDDFVILPFWPAVGADIPLGASLSLDGDEWTGQSIVLKSKLDCEPFRLASGPAFVNYTYLWLAYDGSVRRLYEGLQTVSLVAESGCQYSFAYPESDWKRAFWANTSFTGGTNIGRNALPEVDHQPSELLFNTTRECETGEILFAAQWPRNRSSVETSAHFCHQAYYWADVSVSVRQSHSLTVATLDKDEFEFKKEPVALALADTNAFQLTFLSTQWDEHLFPIRSASRNDRGSLSGPSTLLGAGFNFSVSEMATNDLLLADAARIKQRAFGEAVIASVRNAKRTSASGERSQKLRRVHIVEPIAYVIESVILIQLMLLIGVMTSSRLSVRPLRLRNDPALTSTIVSLLEQSSSVSKHLAPLYRWPTKDAERTLTPAQSRLSSNKLSLQMPPRQLHADHDGRAVPILDEQTRQQWIPFVLQPWSLGSLLVFITTILVTTAILYWFATVHGLYQSAFVYRAAVSIGDITIGTVAPYSILPTLLAVLVGLWWGSIESEFRLVQPFLAMIKAVTRSREGANVTYRTSYLLWAAYKAMHRKHWVLAFVCLGATFSQIRELLRASVPYPRTNRDSHRSHVGSVAENTLKPDKRHVGASASTVEADFESAPICH